jgi:hypothetical protein
MDIKKKLEEIECANNLLVAEMLIDKKLTDVYEYIAFDDDKRAFKKCESLHDYINCSIPLLI